MFRKVKWDYFIRNINCQLNLDRFNRMCCRYLDLFLYSDLIVNSDIHQGKGEGEGGQPAKGKGDGQRQSIGRNNNKPGICSFKYVWVLKKTVSCWSSTIAVKQVSCKFVITLSCLETVPLSILYAEIVFILFSSCS